MATRIPNPCEDVVDEIVCGDGYHLVDGVCIPIEETQSVQAFTTATAEEMVPPIFVQSTIQEPTLMAGRTLTMIDEEYFAGQEFGITINGTTQNAFFGVPFHFGPAGLRFQDGGSNIFPAGFLHSLKASRGLTRDARDTETPEDQKYPVNIDHFRAGMMRLWLHNFLPNSGVSELQWAFTAAGENRRRFIPLTMSLFNPTIFRISDLSSTTKYALYLKDDFELMSKDYVETDGNRQALFTLYLLGQRDPGYENLSEQAKRKYKYGLLPDEDATFVDTVFEHPLPFHKRETNFLNVPAYNVVDISVELRGFKTEIYGRGKLISEYQKASIYRSFFEEKNLENLELTASPQLPDNEGPQTAMIPCIPADRIQKFPSDQVAEMNIANSKLEGQSDNYVRIIIATPQGEENFIAQLLKNNKMDRHLLDLVTSKTEKYDKVGELFTQLMNDPVFVAGARRDTDLFTDNDNAQSGVKTSVNYNFELKIDDQRRFVGARIQDISEYPMGYYNYDKPLMLSFEDAITSQIFLSEFRDYLRTGKKVRTFEDVMNGSKAYSEVVGYHVEKADAATGEVIQDFYFSDSNDVLEIDFIDNQVLLGKKYRYRIYAINMVIALEYTYRHRTPYRRLRREGKSDATLTIDARPKYTIIETPYFEKTVSLYDKPPMFPQVSFVPYQGVEDEIAFLLQANGGEVTELPLPIRESDQEAFEKMADAQDKKPGEMLLYGTDDLPTGFEILCMQGEQPETFADFASADLKRVESHGKTGFFKMNIVPNEYYYAIFRTVEDDMVSNPTEVFRFMMVSYENGIYFDVQTIELEPIKELENITFEKILKLEPTPIDKFLNVAPESDSAVDMTNFRVSAPEFTAKQLGREEDGLWDKKLKIRCISRTTGKEIDIKVVFQREVTTLTKVSLPSEDASNVPPLPEVCED